MKLRHILLCLPLSTLALPAAAQDPMIDVNGDGLLDADELAVGVEAELLPAVDG
jgi:hypothetical protein